MAEQSSMYLHSLNTSEVPLLNLHGPDHATVAMTRPPELPKSAASSSSHPPQSLGADDEEMNPELWYACAGPRHGLPPVGTVVAYFPQGHIEQVASFNNPDVEGYTPRYDLPAAVPCTLNDIQLSADPDTDEVFATCSLAPVSDPVEESARRRNSAVQPRQKSISFTKILTVSDTSTHGGFSVPRRGAEDCFPPLDKTQDNPIQDLIAKDLHGNEWKFRHLFRGQPKRHLLTTGWSVFVSQKRLVAGDAVLFLRDATGQLRIAVRLAPRHQKQPAIMVTSSMAIGVLEAAGHAVTEMNRFSLIYNPRSSPSQFIIPYTKYVNALKQTFTVGQRVKSEFGGSDIKYSNAVKPSPAIGHRSRARFESEDSLDARSTGTIVEISDYDVGKWRGSAWRSIQVNWDDASAEKQKRVSPWEISAFTPSANLPPQDKTRKRYKPVGQPAYAQPPPAMPLSAGTFVRPDPVPAFGSLPRAGLQDLLGIRGLDIQQRETGDFGMKVYSTYRNHVDVGASLQQPMSPRLSTLHSFVKDEPLRDADLQLGVSSPWSKDQAGSKSSSAYQPSLAAFRDPPSWSSPFSLYPEARPPPPVNGPHCTNLSISNLPPDSESLSRSSTPKPKFWESQAPAPAEHNCRIFGVTLNPPAAPKASGEMANNNGGLNGPREVSNVEMEKASMNSLSLAPGLQTAWQHRSEADWQLKLATEQCDYRTSADGSKYVGYGDLVHEYKHMCIDRH